MVPKCIYYVLTVSDILFADLRILTGTRRSLTQCTHGWQWLRSIRHLDNKCRAREHTLRFGAKSEAFLIEISARRFMAALHGISNDIPLAFLDVTIAIFLLLLRIAI